MQPRLLREKALPGVSELPWEAELTSFLSREICGGFWRVEGEERIIQDVLDVKPRLTKGGVLAKIFIP